MTKIGIQQSILCDDLKNYTEKHVNKRNQKGVFTMHTRKNERQ